MVAHTLVGRETGGQAEAEGGASVTVAPPTPNTNPDHAGVSLVRARWDERETYLDLGHGVRERALNVAVAGTHERTLRASQTGEGLHGRRWEQASESSVVQPGKE